MNWLLPFCFYGLRHPLKIYIMKKNHRLALPHLLYLRQVDSLKLQSPDSNIGQDHFSQTHKDHNIFGNFTNNFKKFHHLTEKIRLAINHANALQPDQSQLIYRSLYNYIKISYHYIYNINNAHSSRTCLFFDNACAEQFDNRPLRLIHFHPVIACTIQQALPLLAAPDWQNRPT